MPIPGSPPDEPGLDSEAVTLARLVERATTRPRVPFGVVFRLAPGRSPLDRALDSLIRRWRELDAPTRRRILAADRSRFLEALRRQAASPSDRFARTDAARVARLTPAPEAIEITGALVGDADPVVAGEAMTTLTQLAEHAPRLRSPQQVSLATTLVRLADDGHRDALDMLERLGPAWSPVVRQWFAGADEAALMRVRAAIRQASDADARSRALAWLTTPGCAPGALAALGGKARPALVARALDRAHLLQNPSRRRALKREPRAASAVRSVHPTSDMPVGLRLGRLRWLRLVGDPHLVAACRGAIADPAPAVRALSLRMLANSVGHTDALLDFAFDSAPAISRSATLALAASDESGAVSARAALQRSPHSGTRRLVEPTPTPMWRRRLELRHRLAETPDVTIARLRGRISEGEASMRSRAIQTARRLGVLPRLERELLDAAIDGDPRVAATGVLALGTLWSAPARAAVAGALAHSDPRVRANAIEVVGRRDPAAAAIARAMHSDHARARANAIRSRLYEPKSEAAVDHLEAMLCDDRPEHRRSALWVAERLVVRPVVRRVHRIALQEPDPIVRRRAESCARRLAVGASSVASG